MGETYNVLFLFELHNLCVQLLQPVFQVFLVFQNGHFIFLLHCQLHLPHLEGLLKVGLLLAQVHSPLLLLAPCLVTLIQVVVQVLNLLLLLPEDLPQLVRGVPHVQQHVAQFSHGLGRLV